MDISLAELEFEVSLLNCEISKHFSEFETPTKKLINDGIVNISEYYRSPIKIMWILKEPYDKNSEIEGGWSISEALNDGKLGKEKDVNTWKPIILTTYGLLNNFIKHDEIIRISNKENITHILKKIAYVNVLKLPGETNTTSSTLKNGYLKNKIILLKQISTYRPNIVIGGNTLHLFKEDLKIKKEHELECGHFTQNKILFINTKHPARKNVIEYVNKIIERAETWKAIYLNNL